MNTYEELLNDFEGGKEFAEDCAKNFEFEKFSYTVKKQYDELCESLLRLREFSFLGGGARGKVVGRGVNSGDVLGENGARVDNREVAADFMEVYASAMSVADELGAKIKELEGYREEFQKMAAGAVKSEEMAKLHTCAIRDDERFENRKKLLRIYGAGRENWD